MTLLIETGPTQFKYARLVDGRPSEIEFLVGGSSAAEPPWPSALARLAPTPHAVFVAHGGAATLQPRLAEWIRRAWHIDSQFIVPPTGAVPAAPLGRYLALVGARARGLCPALVVTADVAIGIDLLGADGQRMGVWTFPGERPMREALYAQTSGIAAAALLDVAAVEAGFGVNTAGAVQEGARLAIASCVAAVAARIGAQVAVVATGRYAVEAVRYVPAVQVLENLSLEGLASIVAERTV